MIILAQARDDILNSRHTLTFEIANGATQYLRQIQHESDSPTSDTQKSNVQRHRVQSPKSNVQGCNVQTFELPESNVRCGQSGPWTLDIGLWFGRWALDRFYFGGLRKL